MSRKLYYQWEITPAVDLATEKMNSPRLVIPRKLLKGNTTYKVSIEVGMSEDPDINVKDEATVQTLSSKLEPVVDGLQTVSISDMLELSALKSFDPDGNKEGFNVSYEWQVLNHDKSAVFLEKERLKLPSEAEVKLNVSESLRPRRRYLVVLKYRVGGRVASKVHRLRVVVGSPPKIRVRTLPGVKNPSNKIAIVALVKDFIPGTYEWKCEEVESTGKHFIFVNSGSAYSGTNYFNKSGGGGQALFYPTLIPIKSVKALFETKCALFMNNRRCPIILDKGLGNYKLFISDMRVMCK